MFEISTGHPSKNANGVSYVDKHILVILLQGKTGETKSDIQKYLINSVDLLILWNRKKPNYPSTWD